MSARAAGIVAVVVNVALGLAFVHAGTAARLWDRVERDVPWRNGPTWVGVFAYFAIYWGAWLIVNMALRRILVTLREEDTGNAQPAKGRPHVIPREPWRPGDLGVEQGAPPRDPSARKTRLGMTEGGASRDNPGVTTASLGMAYAAGRALVTSCAIVAIQVLMPSSWLLVVLATLLLVMLVDAYLMRQRIRRAITAWAWAGAGLALAAAIIHPWFVGQPLFVVRLAVLMTLWDWIGEKVGVSRRLTRFVPSLYAGSGWIAAHARVAT